MAEPTTTTRRPAHCSKHAFAPRRQFRPRNGVVGNVTLPAQRHQTGLTQAELASGSSVAGDDPVNNSDPTGQATLGFCGALGGSALGPAGFVQGCLVRTVGTPNDDIGFSGSIGGGGGQSLGAFADGFVEITNADNLNDLRGPFAWFELNVGDVYGGAVIVFVGKGTQNKTIYGMDIGGGINFNVNGTVKGVPFTVAGGVVVTGVHIVRQWWLADPLRAYWDGQAGGMAGEVNGVIRSARDLINDRSDQVSLMSDTWPSC
jgi:hypothetical protein